MKKILLLCLAGALALAASSCDDEKDNGNGFSGKMTVNGQTETIRSAMYLESVANDFREADFRLMLFKDFLTELPEDAPDIFVSVALSESLFDRTIDLTQPVAQSGELERGIHMQARKTPDPYFWISHTGDGKIEVVNSVSGPSDAVVTAGTLTATRNGDNFTIKLSVTLSDGKSIAADWKGAATRLEN